MRVIAASCERIYDALVDPDALTTWLPPRNMTGSIQHYDPHVGGSFRLVLTYSDTSASQGKSTADADIIEARFLELHPGSRVVWAVDFAEVDSVYAGTMTMAWQLTPVHDGSRVRITADGVPDAISPEDHREGMNASLNNLARYLAE